MRVWMELTGSTHSDDPQEFGRRRAQLAKYYESNYQIADFYEAWAIWCFSLRCYILP